MEREKLFYEHQMRFQYDKVKEIDNTSLHTALVEKQSPREKDQPAFVLDSNVSIKIPLTLSENEVLIHDGPTVSLCKLLQLFQEKVMIIYNALLFEKRIVMVGHNKNAGEVASYVLSVCSLAPYIPSVLRRRVFPYISLANMDFLSVPGYIVGATNPMFASREDYWDCMCDLDKGSVQVSSEMMLNQLRNQQLYNYAPNALLQLAKRKSSFNSLIYHGHSASTGGSSGSTSSIMGKQVDPVVVSNRKSMTLKPTVIGSAKKRSRTPTNLPSKTCSTTPSKPSPTIPSPFTIANEEEQIDKDYVFVDEKPEISSLPASLSANRMGTGYLDHNTGMLTFEYGYDDICYLTDLDLHFITKVRNIPVTFTNSDDHRC